MWHYTQWPADTCLVFIIKVVTTSQSSMTSERRGGVVDQSEDVLPDARYHVSTEYIAHEGSIPQVGSSTILVLYLLKMS